MSRAADAAETLNSVLAYGDDYMRGKMSQSDIALAVGITRERVRQVLDESGYPSGRELLRYRRQARRLFHAVAVVAKHTQTQQHGTMRRYELGCRCPRCREANRRKAMVLSIQTGRAAKHVCAVCGESVWRNPTRYEQPSAWRHFRNADHAPEPVLREQVSAAACG